MSSLEEIAALLGFVAFVGLAVLVFLTFQQGRHLRRLRDWAGRAPERAALLAARGEQEGDPESEGEEIGEEELEGVHVVEPGRLAVFAAGVRERWSEVDRRLPVEPRLLFGGLAAIVLGVGIATGGFGLFGGDSASTERASGGNGKGGSGGNRAEGNQGEKQSQATEVAVLNGTAPPGGTGVAGIADRLTADVEGAGFEVGKVDNAGSFTTSTVMWNGSPEAEAEAEELAAALEPVLGTTTVAEMSVEVQTLADGAEVALVIGQDDATI